MRHRKKSEKFSRSRAQRKALIKSLLRALIINERITTTVSRAKYLRGEVDRLITCGKRGRLSDRRRAYQLLGDRKLVRRLFDAIVPRFPKTTGGYTRIFNVGRRRGDGACMAIVELTRVEKKRKTARVSKTKAAPKHAEEHPQTPPPKKEKKPVRGIASRVKKIFKKERDSL